MISYIKFKYCIARKKQSESSALCTTFKIIKAPYPHFNSRRLTFSSDIAEIEVFGHYYSMEYGKKSLKQYTEFSRVYLSVHHFEYCLLSKWMPGYNFLRPSLYASKIRWRQLVGRSSWMVFELVAIFITVLYINDFNPPTESGTRFLG